MVMPYRLHPIHFLTQYPEEYPIECPIEYLIICPDIPYLCPIECHLENDVEYLLECPRLAGFLFGSCSFQKNWCYRTAPCGLLVWKTRGFDSTKFSETFRFRKSGVIDTRLSGFLFGQHSDLIAPNFRKRLLSEILVLSNRCVIRTRRQQGAAFRPSLSSC